MVLFNGRHQKAIDTKKAMGNAILASNDGVGEPRERAWRPRALYPIRGAHQEKVNNFFGSPLCVCFLVLWSRTGRNGPHEAFWTLIFTH